MRGGVGRASAGRSGASLGGDLGDAGCCCGGVQVSAARGHGRQASFRWWRSGIPVGKFSISTSAVLSWVQVHDQRVVPFVERPGSVGRPGAAELGQHEWAVSMARVSIEVYTTSGSRWCR